MKHLLKIVLFINLLAVLPFIQNCDLEEDEPLHIFKWVADGNTLTYDLHSSAGVIANNRILIIEKDTMGIDQLEFEERISVKSNVAFENSLLLGMFSEVLIKKDGLHTTTCFYCNIGACFRSMNYLKVPAQPQQAQSLPVYACSNSIYSHDLIIKVDSVIRVPLGEFKTVAIIDSATSTVKFWNEQIGLIRVDNFNGADTIRLVLSGKNY